jgi:hypothetical protein
MKCVGTLASFKKLFAQTILTGRFPNAKPEEKKVGQARSKKVHPLSSPLPLSFLSFLSP